MENITTIDDQLQNTEPTELSNLALDAITSQTKTSIILTIDPNGNINAALSGDCPW